MLYRNDQELCACVCVCVCVYGVCVCVCVCVCTDVALSGDRIHVAH